jgi:hypothetical protein
VRAFYKVAYRIDKIARRHGVKIWHVTNVEPSGRDAIGRIIAVKNARWTFYRVIREGEDRGPLPQSVIADLERLRGDVVLQLREKGWRGTIEVEFSQEGATEDEMAEMARQAKRLPP